MSGIAGNMPSLLGSDVGASVILMSFLGSVKLCRSGGLLSLNRGELGSSGGYGDGGKLLSQGLQAQNSQNVEQNLAWVWVYAYPYFRGAREMSLFRVALLFAVWFSLLYFTGHMPGVQPIECGHDFPITSFLPSSFFSILCIFSPLYLPSLFIHVFIKIFILCLFFCSRWL